MKDLFFIASAAGLHDGLSSCTLMTCAVFIAMGQWLFPKFSFIWRFIFGLVYFFGVLVFNFGPCQGFFLQWPFLVAAKAVYAVLSVFFFVLGAVFFKDWVLLNRQVFPAPQRQDFFIRGPWLKLLAVLLLGLILSGMSTLWPVDKFIYILGNAAIGRNQWSVAMQLMAGYVFLSLWPLWLLWAFLSVKNVKPSLYKIVCSSIFLTASTCILLVFK